MTTGRQVKGNSHGDSICRASEASSLSPIKDIVEIVDAELFQSVESMTHEFNKNLVNS